MLAAMGHHHICQCEAGQAQGMLKIAGHQAWQKRSLSSLHHHPKYRFDNQAGLINAPTGQARLTALYAVCLLAAEMIISCLQHNHQQGLPRRLSKIGTLSYGLAVRRNNGQVLTPQQKRQDCERGRCQDERKAHLHSHHCLPRRLYERGLLVELLLICRL